MKKNVLAMCMVAALSVVLAGSSGWATRDASPSPEQGAIGRLFPAVSGLVAHEYDDAGDVLQRSTPSDADGAFSFGSSVSGKPVLALGVGFTDGLLARGSPLGTQQNRIDLTPLTSLQKDLAASGKPVSEVNAWLAQLVTSQCGIDAGQQAMTALAGTAGVSPPPAWLLRALLAYVQALNGIGIVAGPEWSAKLAEHGPLLQAMCTVAQRVSGSAWLRQLQMRLPVGFSADMLVDGADLAALQTGAIDEVLRMMGTAAAVREYPSLGPLLGTRVQSWHGRESEIALAFAQTQLTKSTAAAATGLAIGPGRTGPDLATRLIGPEGNVWQMLSSKVRVNAAGDALWRLAHGGVVDRSLRLSIAGTPLFDRTTLVDAVLRLPKLAPDEGLHKRAWRFLIKWRVPSTPISGGQFQHQADLYLRSIGAGRCDDDASALRELWANLGFEARVVALGGHIVPEVRVGGRWEMYDPHLSIYYHTRDGRVAGVSDLQRDPSLVSNPVDPLPDVSGIAFNEEVTGIYASGEDNVVMPWYSQIPQEPLGSEFMVPAGGHLEIAAGTSYAFPSMDGLGEQASVPTAQVRIWFPPGYSGPPMDLPLILGDATGRGTLTILGADISVVPEGIRPVLERYYQTDPDRGVSRAQIKDVGAGGLTLTLLLNRLYFPPGQIVVVAATAASLSGFQVTTATAR